MQRFWDVSEELTQWWLVTVHAAGALAVLVLAAGLVATNVAAVIYHGKRALRGGGDG